MQAIPQHRTVFDRAEPFAGRGTGRKGQAGLRAGQPVAYDFLNRRFLPLCRIDGHSLPKGKNVERDFFGSLSILAGAYGFEPMDVSGKAYPYNILLAHWQAGSKIQAGDPMASLVIVQNKGKTALATKTVYNTGPTLFYIPVLPLHRLLNDPSKKSCAELLLSVFAYLHQIAGVPFYRDQDSYLYWQYQMIEDWLTQEPEGWEQGDLQGNMDELETAAQTGDLIKALIFEKSHLEDFERRLQVFMPSNDLEKGCCDVAKAAFCLLTEYPRSTVFDYMEDLGEQQDSEEYYIKAEQYISFIADSRGWLFENLTETVNNEFNECGSIQEPVVWTVYDGSANAVLAGLEFEKRVFALIEDLCNLLEDIS